MDEVAKKKISLILKNFLLFNIINAYIIQLRSWEDR
jgi:hypothetical protein